MGMGFLVFFGCVIFFFRVGSMENGRGVLAAAASILVWFLTAFLLHPGMGGMILGQVVLFVVWTLWRCRGFK